MTLKEAHYRPAVNNKKCGLCGYRFIRKLPHGFTARTCQLFGVTIDDDRTCDYWKID